METYLNGIDKGLATVMVEVDKDEFENAKTKVFNRNRKYFNIKGFRKGRAPRKLIEDHYGKDIFDDDAIELLVNDELDKIYNEMDVVVISAPLITKVDREDDGSLEITLELSVYPEAQLADTSKYVLPEVAEVTDEDVVAELEDQYKEFFGNDEVVLDDNFAKNISDYETLDEYKDYVKSLLTEENIYKNQLINQDTFIEDFLANSKAEFSDNYKLNKEQTFSDSNKELVKLIDKYDLLSKNNFSDVEKYVKFFENSAILEEFINQNNLVMSPEEKQNAGIMLVQRGIFDIKDLKTDDPDNSQIIISYLTDYLTAREGLLNISRENQKIAKDLEEEVNA